VQARDENSADPSSSIKFNRTDMRHGFGLGFTRASGITMLTNRPIFGIEASNPDYIEDPTLSRSQPPTMNALKPETFGLVSSADAGGDGGSVGTDEDHHILDNDFVAFEGSEDDTTKDDVQRDGITSRGGVLR
jgi:hypothetical protein